MGWAGFASLDLWLALLAFQPVDLVPQTLNLGLCVPQVGALGFDQVQQLDNQLPGILVLDVAQVYGFKHEGAILLRQWQIMQDLLHNEQLWTFSS